MASKLDRTFLIAGLMLMSACAPRRLPESPVYRDTPLVHGARVRIVVADLGDDVLQGVLSLEGGCVVWLPRAVTRPRYVDIGRVTAIQVSDVQEAPRGDWPAGVMGPVAGEVWTDVHIDLLGELQRRCLPAQES